MQKNEILKKAVQAFQKNTGLNVIITTKQHNNLNFENNRIDTFIKLFWEDLEFEFSVEVKNVVNHAVLGILIDRFRMIQKRGIMIAHYINRNLAEVLKNNNIQFLDTAGNAYINTPPVFVFLTGQKASAKYDIDTAAHTLNPAALQVLYALLCEPALVNETYRNIAVNAQVALGSVHKTLYELKKTGHLVEPAKNRRLLIRKKELLERWVTEYPRRLRPRLLIGRFQAQENNWWKNQDIRKFGAYWGGEIAAKKLTEYLKPHKATIYMEKLNSEFILRYRLEKNREGNIEIMRIFWDDTLNHLTEDAVHPILIYADLMALAESRAAETARIIYETKITELIGKD